VHINNTLACLSILFSTLNSNEKTRVQRSTATIFTASKSNPTNAQITFNYDIGDRSDSITKYIMFDILP
jgi:hypothetical protein